MLFEVVLGLVIGRGVSADRLLEHFIDPRKRLSHAKLLKSIEKILPDLQYCFLPLLSFAFQGHLAHVNDWFTLVIFKWKGFFLRARSLK